MPGASIRPVAAVPTVMTANPISPAVGVADALDAEGLRPAVRRVLDAFVARQASALWSVSPDLCVLVDILTELLARGKRLRPAFCYWGWRGAGGAAGLPAAVRAAASLELFHAAALLHDDVMDGSDTRRGMASAHRRFEARHRAQGLRGDPA